MSNPPVAKTVPFTFTHLERTFSDPYAWLQEKSNPEVLAYLQAENAYAQDALAHTAPLQEQLFQEMRGRIAEDDSSAPEPRGAYAYYWRMQAGEQYRIFCRRPISGSPADEETLLNENSLAEGKAYCRVFFFEPSPDQKLLAYSVDTTGAWVFDLYIKDLRTGELVCGPIPNTAYTAAWASDSRTLFYTGFDHAHRPYQLLRHTVGQDPARDALVYHELDEAFSVRISRARSGVFLLLTLASATTSEVRFLHANQPAGEFRLIHPRQHWMEYYLEHAASPDDPDGRFLIRTNDNALNFKLMEAPAADPARMSWREILPNRADTFLEDVDAFQNHLVLYERHGGLPQIRVSALDGLTRVHQVRFPDAVYTFSHAANPEFDTLTLRFFYNSLVTPVSTIDYNMHTHEWA
ncbi:MAG: S9 family peptidase, partial [Anaerolineaceae bacterium]|nr:S9 family peptidase [Anaerolineaceae bacterium]